MLFQALYFSSSCGLFGLFVVHVPWVVCFFNAEVCNDQLRQKFVVFVLSVALPNLHGAYIFVNHSVTQPPPFPPFPVCQEKKICMYRKGDVLRVGCVCLSSFHIFILNACGGLYRDKLCHFVPGKAPIVVTETKKQEKRHCRYARACVFPSAVNAPALLHSVTLRTLLFVCSEMLSPPH
jgi:hypothetical protein